jgi:ankyrin repeat protein
MSALLHALLREDAAELRALLATRAPIPNDEENTLLCMAAAHPDIAWLRALLDSGLAPDAAQCGETALFSAAARGHVLHARLLLERGADLDAMADDGSTPLLAAIRNKQDIMEAWLRRRGAH